MDKPNQEGGFYMPLLKKSPPKPKSGGSILMIPEQEIMPNPTQPRRHFDRQELANLAQSIRTTNYRSGGAWRL